MKMQLIASLLSVICLLGGMQPACAQGASRFGRSFQAIKKYQRALSIKTKQPTLPNGGVQRSADEVLNVPVYSLSGVETAVNQQVQTQAAQRVSQRKAKRALQMDLQQVRQAYNAGAWVRSTFQARSESMVYSGTVFKIEYNGQEEIYGVVATHVIAKKLKQNVGLHKLFLAEVLVDGELVAIPAQVVQVGAVGMMDLSLVKFRREDEKYFRPLRISPDPINPGDRIWTQGFVHGRVYPVKERIVHSVSQMHFFSLIQGEQHKRRGLCGAALINQAQELVGIHTGSQMSLSGPDMGFATPAQFLPTLVRAYHNDGEARYALELSGQAVLNLRPDEYVSDAQLESYANEILWRSPVWRRMSMAELQEAIDTHHPRYVEFTVRRLDWAGKQGREFVHITPERLLEGNMMTYRYDLQEGKLISQSKYTKLKKYLLRTQ